MATAAHPCPVCKKTTPHTIHEYGINEKGHVIREVGCVECAVVWQVHEGEHPGDFDRNMKNRKVPPSANR